MMFPDLLATRRGRLTTFFLLYITEGVPLGFAAVALATQMRRQGIGAGAISAFVGAIYLPWTFKWLMGPIVDVVASNRFGRRRAWILSMQLCMVISLLAIRYVGVGAGIQLLTTLIIIHNVFAATQDVAIDALAVGVLKEDERGMAGGLTFAAAYLGQALGGSGALWVASRMGFGTAFYFVAASIIVITIVVVLPLREPRMERDIAIETSRRARIVAEIRGFVVEACKAFTATRAARVGLLFAIMPGGAMALGLALINTIAVDVGFTDSQIAALTLWMTIAAAAGCVVGGWLSDRVGRRGALAWFIASMSPPTLWLAWALWHGHIIMPLTAQLRASMVIPAAVTTALWISVIVYSIGNGLMYGARAALFMDISNPRVAATQFTAYMALLNLGIAISARWQGWAVERVGYPLTLAIDSGAGLLCLIFLASMGRITPREAAVPMPRTE